MKYKLQEIIDIEHFQNLQDRLNEIYSFPSAIIDNEGNILTATAWQDICTQFHRKNKECERHCIQSDQYILSHLNEANPAVSYRCPHGLVDNATPIIIEGVHYGNFFTGQFFLEKPDMQFFRGQAKKYGFSEDAYLEAVKKVPIWTREQLNSYLFFIKELIAILSESGLKRLQEMETRKQIEESEELADTVLRQMREGFWIVSAQLGQVVDVNEAMCRMLGYDRHEMLKMSVADVDADDPPERVAQRIHDIIQAGSAHFETRFRRKDGTLIDVEVGVMYLASRKMLFGFHRDITERKRQEEALRESEARFREMADLLPMAVFETDMRGILTYANRYAFELFGYTDTDFQGGLNVLQMLVPEDRDRAADAVHRLLAGNPTDADREYRGLKKEGSSFPVDIYSSRIVNKDRVVGMRGVIVDMREQESAKVEQERLRNQLFQAQKLEAIGSLAGGVAHDFNNILGAIMGYAEMARLDLQKDSLARSYLDQIFKGSERARDLVKHMLAFARRSEPGLRPMKVGLVVKEVLKLLRASFPSTVDIRQDIEASHDTILGDPSQIHQVLMNLGTNANHAMRESGGVLEVSLAEEVVESQELYPEIRLGRYVRLRVRDTGHGMSKEVMERIFDPYFTTKEVGVGTGLGLAVVHGIVRGHGGAIRVESESGKGATFTILLPVLEREVASELAQQGEIPRGTGRILFVDDEPQLAELGRRMLEHLGYEVVTRTSSVEALEAFRAQPERFDLVITDMTMPQMTGDRLAEEMLKIRPGLLIILCTGFSQRVSDEKAAELGVKALVMKPLVMREIGSKVREVLALNIKDF